MGLAARKTVDVNNEVFADELKPGTQLLYGQFTIESFLNSGGFGITYLARDSLDRQVVIKECFPGSFCRRSKTIVGARSRAHQAEFRSFVKLFVQEAFSLSKLKHQYIVGVHQVFEDNDTAYMAMDYIDGVDLLETLEEGATRLSPDEIVAVLQKVLSAVGFVHSQGVLHRDISPDNILLDRKTGNPVLIDFGAAREEVSKASRALSAMRVVKDGYSPQEFYINGSVQGPSSDLFALAATFYHLITGDTPVNSQMRLSAVASRDPDPYVPLFGNVSGFSPAFLKAIDKALSVFPKDRIKSAEAWLAMIAPGASELDDASAKVRTPSKRPASVRAATGMAVARRSLTPVIAASLAVIAVVAGLAAWRMGVIGKADDTGLVVSAATVVAAPPIAPDAGTASAQTDVAQTEVAVSGVPAPEIAPAQAVTQTVPAAIGAVPLSAESVPALAVAEASPPVVGTARTDSTQVFVQSRAVDLPFIADAQQKNVIARTLPGAPVWMQPGQRIVEVNGIPVGATDDLREIMMRGADATVQPEIQVTLGVQAFEGAKIVRKAEVLSVVDHLSLDTGLQFAVRNSTSGPRTVVTAVPAGVDGGLQVGDVLVAYAPTQEKIDAAKPLSAILSREIEKRVTTYSFAVQREGGMIVSYFMVTLAG